MNFFKFQFRSVFSD